MTNDIVIALCVVALVGLLAASVVCGMHAVGGEHCKCPVCCVFSVLGAVLSIVAVLGVVVRCAMRGARRRAAAARQVVALHTVKLNC